MKLSNKKFKDYKLETTEDLIATSKRIVDKFLRRNISSSNALLEIEQYKKTGRKQDYEDMKDIVLISLLESKEFEKTERISDAFKSLNRYVYANGHDGGNRARNNLYIENITKNGCDIINVTKKLNKVVKKNESLSFYDNDNDVQINVQLLNDVIRLLLQSLTPTQRKIFLLTLHGYSTSQIAIKLHYKDYRNVCKHLRHINVVSQKILDFKKLQYKDFIITEYTDVIGNNINCPVSDLQQLINDLI